MTDQPAHPEHAIRCPWCQAPARQRCTTRRGRHLGVPSHQVRIDAWATHQHNAST
jgi:hypothetical protein